VAFRFWRVPLPTSGYPNGRFRPIAVIRIAHQTGAEPLEGS